jgi:acyl carrier protein
MTKDEIRTLTLKVLTTVAPNIEPQSLDADVNFRDQFDFDSVDYLNFVLALGKEVGIEIPESDFPKLSSLNGCIGYLAENQPRA